MELTARELNLHREKVLKALEQYDWDTALIADKENQYYLTGTRQDALLVLQRSGEMLLFVRRSYERAQEESPLRDLVKPMKSYRDMGPYFPRGLGKVLVQKEKMPLAMLERIEKALGKSEALLPLDRALTQARAVKTPFEQAILRQCGEAHRRLLIEAAPALMREGMTEAELMGKLYAAMMDLGYQGVSRFSMFQVEIGIGQMGFGENSLAPTSFDGPDGMKGMYAASISAGSRERQLRRGDLVFLDLAFGMHGYHTDKTQVYSFGGQASKEAAEIHGLLRQVQDRAAAMMRPGAAPAAIYQTVSEELDPRLTDFMGYRERKVAFLGHGVGLYVDEAPVIARGFDEPMQAGMAVALEPKMGLAGLGTVGVEETYLIGKDGAECITGGNQEIMEV